MTEPAHPRRIRSFVKRETRLTDAQARAIDTLLPLYELPRDDLIDLKTVLPFNDIILEIGIGKGESLFAQAAKNPHQGFIGVEVHRPGLGQFLNRVHNAGLKNVRVCYQDVTELLKHLPPKSLTGIQIFFPDPWPKSRHHKRRLIQAEFLDLVHPLLKPGGFIHCATDWEEYAMHMLAVFKADPRFENVSDNGFIPRPDRIVSAFEARGLRLGHHVWDIWVRIID